MLREDGRGGLFRFAGGLFPCNNLEKSGIPGRESAPCAGHKSVPFSTPWCRTCSSRTAEHQNRPGCEMKTKSGANHPAQLCLGSLQLNSDQFKTLFSLQQKFSLPPSPLRHKVPFLEQTPNSIFPDKNTLCRPKRSNKGKEITPQRGVFRGRGS